MKQIISKDQARNFLLQKQLLSPHKKFQGKQGIEDVFNSLRLIQYDPLNPCGRNVDLVLQARIKGYHPGEYLDWLYRQKKGIEIYDKMLCIIPIGDLPLIGPNSWQRENRPRIKSFFKKYNREIEELLFKISSSGPISSADILGKGMVDSGWGTKAQWGRMALEALWITGRLVISKRDNGRKYYDLPERTFSNLKSFPKGYIKIAREHVARRINSVGMLPKSGSGGGWLGMGSARELSMVIKDLVNSGKLIEIEVDGIKPLYVINAADLAMLEKTTISENKMFFLAPLDNLIWDRTMIKNLFDFDYRWEVYVPADKRKFGYYVLPILYSDQFVGRVEPVLKNGKLEIKGLWKEKEWDQKMEQAYQTCLEDFKNYLQVE